MALAISIASAGPADADRNESPDGEKHWSFRPLAQTRGPHTLDSFIDARLAENGLRRSPAADPAKWLRRVTLDLIGLPPTPEAVLEFEQNPDFAAAIERLLASPRYGERWAQHWLDVIWWAETVGFETNKERQNACPTVTGSSPLSMQTSLTTSFSSNRLQVTPWEKTRLSAFSWRGLQTLPVKSAAMKPPCTGRVRMNSMRWSERSGRRSLVSPSKIHTRRGSRRQSQLDHPPRKRYKND